MMPTQEAGGGGGDCQCELCGKYIFKKFFMIWTALTVGWYSIGLITWVPPKV